MGHKNTKCDENLLDHLNKQDEKLIFVNTKIGGNVKLFYGE